jgi:hypothetical protein
LIKEDYYSNALNHLHRAFGKMLNPLQISSSLAVASVQAFYQFHPLKTDPFSTSKNQSYPNQQGILIQYSFRICSKSLQILRLLSSLNLNKYKMKRIIVLSILLTAMLSFKASAQDEVQIRAYYIGMDDNGYVFMDEFEEEITFTECDKMVLKKYDLSGEEEISQYFMVTYLEDNEDERKIIKLEYAELEIEEEEDLD